MLVGLLIVSMLTGLAVAVGVVAAGCGLLVALLAYSLSGSLTLVLLATLAAMRPRI